MTKINETKKELEAEKETMSAIHRRKDFEEVDMRLDDIIIQMEHAYSWTKRRCYAKRRKVGAIIFKNGRAISSGFNGTPPNHPNICEKDNVTLSKVIHAEENALFKLFEKGSESPTNSSVFVTTAPCPSCAKYLSLAKISSVYFTELYRDVSGLETLIKEGISVYHVDLKKVHDFDKETELKKEFDYQNFPKDFLTTIYKSTEINNTDAKIEAILKIRDFFSTYEDGKYHKKYYDTQC